MRQILAVTSGRWDETPLRPVLRLLKNRYQRLDVKGLSPSGVCAMVTGRMHTAQPDIMLLLGDRFETLAAALSATVAGIPIAHIHGGETTVGSFDNQIRDAISKLAHIHFVAAEQFRDKLISIGESPERIHVVGAPGLDNLVDLPPKKSAISRTFKMANKSGLLVPALIRESPYFIATFHPVTIGEESVRPMIEAMAEFPDHHVIWTGVNNDPGAEKIREEINYGIGDMTPPTIKSFEWGAYHEACRNAAVVVGNSSSGLIEMPVLEVPTVNVGDRQKGRPCGPSVFNCPNEKMAIVAAVKAALEYDGPYTSPYGGPGASKKIADILLNAKIDMRKE